MEASNFCGSGSGTRVLLLLWPFLSKVKNLNVVQFFVKYMSKSDCSIDHHSQKFKGLWFIEI